MKNVAKKAGTRVRLRDLARFEPCDGSLDKAVSVLGSEVTVHGESVSDYALAEKAADNEIQIPWLSKLLSSKSNRQIAMEVADDLSDEVYYSMESPNLEEIADEVQDLLAKAEKDGGDLDPNSASSTKMRLHVAQRTTKNKSDKLMIEALSSLITFYEYAGDGNDRTVNAAITMVDKIAEFDAFMSSRRAKAPIFSWFISAFGKERSCRSVASKKATKKVVKKTVKKAKAKKTCKGGKKKSKK